MVKDIVDAEINTNMEKIIIGNSDYSRKEIEDGIKGYTIGSSSNDVLETIKYYEGKGYTVKFETSIFRKIFAIAIYKIVAYK